MIGEWISVETNPPNYGEYLVCDSEIMDIFVFEGVWFDPEQTTLMSPTHWMPLPELPK